MDRELNIILKRLLAKEPLVSQLLHLCCVGADDRVRGIQIDRQREEESERVREKEGEEGE